MALVKQYGLFILTLAMTLVLSGCLDKQNPPYLRNDTKMGASVRISYNTRQSPSEGILAPYSNMGHAETGLFITGIHIDFENGASFDFDENALDAERLRRGQQPLEFWILNEAGISLGTVDDWEKLRNINK